ncbi:MAG: metal-dependent transcriptional regulator [Opitutales bacterium]|nr:metal-dependent transcriptional regulator [Opitutales bacterium]
MEEHSKKLSENLEDYLETISSLSAEKGSARMTDIASAMSVKKPSVNSALNVLAQRGLVIYEKYKPVLLTQAGEALAENVRRKHKLLSDFLTNTLGVNKTEADVAACKMEHALEDSIMKKLVEFLETTDANLCSSCSKKNGDCSKKCKFSVSVNDVDVGDRCMVLDCGNEKNVKFFAKLNIHINSILDVVSISKDEIILRVGDSDVAIPSASAPYLKVKRI